MCVTAAGDVTKGTGKFQAKRARHAWREEVLLSVKSRTEVVPKGATLRNPELDIIAKMFLGCLGMDMRMCCQQRGVQLAILDVVAELECPFAEAMAHALSLTILDA